MGIFKGPYITQKGKRALLARSMYVVFFRGGDGGSLLYESLDNRNTVKPV